MYKTYVDFVAIVDKTSWHLPCLILDLMFNLQFNLILTPSSVNNGKNV